MKIRELRKRAGLSQEQLSKELKVSRSAVAMWESSVNEPDAETLSRIADFFGVTVDYLLGRTDEPSPAAEIPGLLSVKKKKFPVLGKVACGEPIFAEEDRETWIMASADIDADFCLVAQGESMAGAHIDDGDIVFIKQTDVVPNGYIAVVLVEDEATLKYIDWRPEQSTLILTPANPAFRTQVYTGEELNHIHVIGMAVLLQKNLMHAAGPGGAQAGKPPRA